MTTARQTMQPVTIIVPVYGGLAYTARCLDSVVRHAGGRVHESGAGGIDCR